MWLVLVAIICFTLGWFGGKFDATRRMNVWRKGLPDELRDMFDYSIKQYPVDDKQPQ